MNRIYIVANQNEKEIPRKNKNQQKCKSSENDLRAQNNFFLAEMIDTIANESAYMQSVVFGCLMCERCDVKYTYASHRYTTYHWMNSTVICKNVLHISRTSLS